MRVRVIKEFLSNLNGGSCEMLISLDILVTTVLQY